MWFDGVEREPSSPSLNVREKFFYFIFIFFYSLTKTTSFRGFGHQNSAIEGAKASDFADHFLCFFFSVVSFLAN